MAQKSAVELDDVSWQQTNSDPTNTTVFRDDVVTTLRQLNPGTIRMMAAGAALGSDLPNQLQVPYARYRMGFNADGTSYPNIAYGIHEFLQLCQAVGADPWITIPTATTPSEMTAFIQYLTGTGSDSWSQLRIARGQSAPWTSVFGKVHLELGNETWNGAFKGESMNYPGYPQWANQVFGAARKTSGYQASKFDLVLSGLAATPGYNKPMLSYSTQHDSFDVAPYLLFQANDEAQSLQFGALFAEPEVMESAGGEIYQNMIVGAGAPSATSSSTAVSVYETNLGTMGGNITKAELDALTPSIGAGLAHTDHMLQMMRLGVQYQNAFALPQYEYRRSDGSLTRLWGLVVDMGTTNRRRPTFQTQAMANAVIGGTMMQTTQLGANPTWNQPLSSDGVILNGAHSLQSFSFLNGTQSSAVVFNLSQTAALPVIFSGENAPAGNVQMTQITSANITDNNEFADVVEPKTTTLNGFNASAGLTLPPFSMTVLTWTSTFTQAPNFSVAAGTFSANQTVALSSSTANATIYYTVDGSKPTTGSTLYTGPITVSKSQTINAIAVSANLSTSPVASATYVIQPVAAAPTFSIATGIYNAGQLVVILDIVPGSTIYYTTDGSTPTTSSNVYLLPILVSTNQTLNAIAAAPDYTNSLVATAKYTIAPPTVTPVISVASGTYQKTQYVQVTAKQAGATVYCTSDGSTPVATAAEICTSGVTVTSSVTVKAIAVAPTYSSSPVVTANYVIAPYVATPALSVPGGTYNMPQTVAVSTSTPGAAIYYTTDSTTPTTSSPKYTGPITISSVNYLQTMAVASGFTQSFAATANYVMTTGTPVITVSGSKVSLSTVTPGATIYYTTSGSAPSTSSTAYTGPFTITGTVTVKAMAGLRNWVNSAVASSSVTASVGAGTTPTATTPVFSVGAGSYTAAQTVSITSATAGAKIYYTINGTTPTTASTLYNGPVSVAASETLEAITVASGYNNSAVASAVYTINVASAPAIIAPGSLSINGSTTLVGNAVVLTNGGAGQAGTAWTKTVQKVTGFDTQFDIQMPTSKADGFTFTLQNAPKAQYALGGNVSGLGYQFITNSVAVAFNLYQTGVTNAQSVGVYTGGVSPQAGNAINLNGTGINMHSGDTLHIEIAYQGTTLGVKITDKVTGATTSQSFTVDIPSNVGGGTAYVGFTGSTGGQTAIQNISNWSFTPSN
jgi:hypothetical protein